MISLKIYVLLQLAVTAVFLKPSLGQSKGLIYVVFLGHSAGAFGVVTKIFIEKNLWEK